MHNRLIVSLFAAGFASVAGNALAADHCSANEAKAMADKAVAAVKSLGADKAFAEFSQKDNPAWHNKDCYVFVVKYDGMVGAHGGNAALVGKNVLDMKDADGQPFQKLMIDKAKTGSGWVDYKWSNPVSKEISAKSSYVQPLPGLNALAGVGIYK
ncbi:MAG TPA: cache domain-containing protein [Rhodocyclaceae bacterium]|nr:cache domain-containing protein [Rhodocyclaceae bacterium]